MARGGTDHKESPVESGLAFEKGRRKKAGYFKRRKSTAGDGMVSTDTAFQREGRGVERVRRLP